MTMTTPCLDTWQESCGSCGAIVRHDCARAGHLTIDQFLAALGRIGWRFGAHTWHCPRAVCQDAARGRDKTPRTKNTRGAAAPARVTRWG